MSSSMCTTFSQVEASWHLTHTHGLITHPGPSPHTHTHPNKSKDTINFTIFLITAGAAGYDLCTINMLIPVKLVRLNE